MAVSLHFHLLLLMGVALSVVTCSPAVDCRMVQTDECLLSGQLEISEVHRELDDHHKDSRITTSSWRESIQDTEYQSPNAIVSQTKTKRQCRNEIFTHGYAESTQECKDKFQLEKLICEVQAEFKGVVFSDLCKKLVDLKTCQEKRDCRNSATKACCWVPGSNHGKQCVLEVPNLYLMSFSKNMYTRQSLLQDAVIPRSFTTHSLVVNVLPVGQGDCIAMYCSNKLVLFDCGSTHRRNALTAKEAKTVILNKVDMVTIFISHGDEDHYKYLPTVFSDIGKVDRVIIGGRPDEYAASNAIKKWIHMVASHNKLYAINRFQRCIGDCNSKLHAVHYVAQNNAWSTAGHPMTTLESMNICDGSSISFDIIAANVGEKTNQKSIVLKVKDVERSMLLSGDMEGDAAKIIAETVPGRLKATVFQISHHGAATHANTWQWLRAIRPKEAFVSHVYNGRYGHPRCDAIERLLGVGSISTNTIIFHLTHPFYCARSIGAYQYDHYSGETCHSIFSTYPKPDKICVVMFRLGIFPYTTYTCYSV